MKLQVHNFMCSPLDYNLFRSGPQGQFDANFTLQNVWGRLQPGMRSLIQCLSDENHKKIKFSRLLDTGQGTRLPSSSQQFMQGKPVFARILFMPGEDNLNRFGVFQCKIIRQNIGTRIVALKLPPSNLAELDAVSPYNVANLGDDVELEVNVTKPLELPVKWMHDGKEVPEWNDLLKVQLDNVQPKDSGIYECFYEGRREEGVHALMRLLVRRYFDFHDGNAEVEVELINVQNDLCVRLLTISTENIWPLVLKEKFPIFVQGCQNEGNDQLYISVGDFFLQNEIY
ncbi:multiple epidermal growth factor-like domains protein 10 [Trichonephila clavipes]|nr:multiple epidermal growth factor-like domains protein 10 [Trichonephila clavipes]